MFGAPPKTSMKCVAFIIVPRSSLAQSHTFTDGDNHSSHSEEATLHSDSILHAHLTSTVGPKSSLHERLETQGDAE